MSDAPAPVLTARNLGRRFGRIRAVRNIDLAVRRGEIVGIVGPDGAGKSTLLQLFAAILDPDEGACTVLGFDTRAEAASVTARIGYMPQGFTLYERLTVDENLAFAARIRGVTPEELGMRSERLLAMAGLSRFRNRRESALSGGMRKKLALCTNLIHHPPLLLLDEPALGVDPLSRRELWRMLEAFRGEGATIILSTSYMDEADRCDRVAVLDGGRVVALGAPAVLRGSVSERVFAIGTERPADVERLLRHSPDVVGVQRRPAETRFMIAEGQRLADDLVTALDALGTVRESVPSMEDVFVALRGIRAAAPVIEDQPGGVAPAWPIGHHGPAIVTRGVTCRFGAFTAVDAVSIEISPGEVFGLLGANGAGKTTLIRMLCGLLPPSAGTAEVAGIDVAADPRRLRRHIGYMSQRFSLYPDLTARENLAFFASASGLAPHQGRTAIAQMSAATGLAEVLNEPVTRLSGAIRQRLALASALLHRPAVLFLDEPTSGVDPESRFRFWRLIGDAATAGTTVVVTTHYLEEATYCHRLGLMHEGRLIAAGDLDALRAGLTGEGGGTIEDVFVAYIARERERGSSMAAERR